MEIPESEQEAFRSQYLNVLRMAGALVAADVFTSGEVQYRPEDVEDVIECAEAIVYCAWKRYDVGRCYGVGATSPLTRSVPQTSTVLGGIGDDKGGQNGE